MAGDGRGGESNWLPPKEAVVPGHVRGEIKPCQQSNATSWSVRFREMESLVFMQTDESRSTGQSREKGITAANACRSWMILSVRGRKGLHDRI